MKSCISACCFGLLVLFRLLLLGLLYALLQCVRNIDLCDIVEVFYNINSTYTLKKFL